jgi:HK97 family phage major capsid protein
MKFKALTDAEELTLRRAFPGLGFLGRLGKRLGDVSTEEMSENCGRLVAANKRLLDDAKGERLSDEEQAASAAAGKLLETWTAELRERAEGRGSNRPRIMADGDLGGFGSRRTRPPNGIPLRLASGEETRALAPNESFTEYLRERGDIREDHSRDGLTFGSLVRAMVRGPRTEAEKFALAEGSDSAGGVSVPTDLLAEFIDALRPRARVIESGARTIPLSTEKTSVARITGYPTVEWRDENADVATSEPTFDKIEFTARSLACICVASRELIADSINADAALTQVLAKSVGDELDRVALLGSGVAPEPKGISKYSGAGGPGVVSMGDNGGALTSYDALLDALLKIQAADADDSALSAILNPREANALAKLKDSTDQPLRRPPALENVAFRTTTKLPLTEVQGSSNNASRIIVGDFSQCWVGIRLDARVEILRELYAGKYQLGFLVSLRADIAFAHLPRFAQIVGVIPASA